MQNNYSSRKVSIDEVFSVLGTVDLGSSKAFSGLDIDPHIGEISLVYTSTESEKPFLVVIPTVDQREVLARIATYGRELAPLSQWIRVLPSDWARRLFDGDIQPVRSKLAAAWSGAIIGEILAREPLDFSEIPLSWVYATTGFTIAKFRMLWFDLSSNEKIIKDVEECRSLMRAPSAKVMPGLDHCWTCLSNLEKIGSRSLNGLTEPAGIFYRACLSIKQSGLLSSENIKEIAQEVPILRDIAVIDSIAPEDRIRFFDQIQGALQDSDLVSDKIKVAILEFSLGYIVGRIGGGETNVSLLKQASLTNPACIVWATILPSLFKPYMWGKAFDGLGRLVLRELSSSFHPTDAPESDISLDELRVTMLPKVNYRKLPFRTAQRGFAQIEIAPGVMHAVRLQVQGGGIAAGNTATAARRSGHQTSLLDANLEKGGLGLKEDDFDIRSLLLDFRKLLDTHLSPELPSNTASASRWPKKKR